MPNRCVPDPPRKNVDLDNTSRIQDPIVVARNAEGRTRRLHRIWAQRAPGGGGGAHTRAHARAHGGLAVLAADECELLPEGADAPALGLTLALEALQQGGEVREAALHALVLLLLCGAAGLEALRRDLRGAVGLLAVGGDLPVEARQEAEETFLCPPSGAPRRAPAPCTAIHRLMLAGCATPACDWPPATVRLLAAYDWPPTASGSLLLLAAYYWPPAAYRPVLAAVC